MDKIFEIKQRVKNLIDERGISYNSLSLKLGKNQTYLHQFLTRPSPKRLDEDFRRKLAIELGVDEQQLTDRIVDKSSSGVHQIGYVQAGVFTEHNQLPPSEWKQVQCSVPKAFQDKKVFALGVKGDSMNKVFPADKTKLICVAIEDYVKYKEVKNGDFIIAERQTPDGMYETTVKRYNKLPDGTIVLEAMSTDLQYNNIIIGQDNAEYRIVAVVIKYKVTLKGF